MTEVSITSMNSWHWLKIRKIACGPYGAQGAPKAIGGWNATAKCRGKVHRVGRWRRTEKPSSAMNEMWTKTKAQNKLRTAALDGTGLQVRDR